MKITNKNYKEDLFVLLATCGHLEKLLKEIFGGFVIEINKTRNEQYLAYVRLINYILNKKGFEDVRNNFTPIFEDLYETNVMDGGDVDWDKIIKPNISKLIRQISKKINDAGYEQKIEKKLLLAHIKILVSEASAQEKIVARLIYDNKREVKINGYKLSKPNFCSDNDKIFSYIFENPNRTLMSTEIITITKTRVNGRKFTQMISDLHFEGVLKKLFFPNISTKAIHFRNPIYMKNLIEEGISYKELTAFLSKIERKSKK